MIYLELNNTGAWKRVMNVPDGNEPAVMRQVENLMILAVDGGARTSWRLKDQVGPVLAYWNSDSGWKETGRG